MPRFLLPLLALVLSAPFAAAAEKSLATLVDEQFTFAARQYAGLIDRMAEEKPDRQPRSFINGKFQTTNLEGWTSGFFPGSLWFIYEHTRDPRIKAAAEKFTARQEPIKHFTKHHDVGFMLFGSYGQGQRIDPRPAYRDVLIQGARSLATRYSPATGVIRSWDSPPWKFPVIIDNMMNLDLLWYAADEAKDEALRAIAISHADKTLANHYRPDGSSYHLLDYEPATGEVIKRQTVQGFADDSAWARGQAWGLYGFTTMFRLSKKGEYLVQACKIADFMAAHPNLPADGIPYWDFNAPRIPDALRDVAAGAIMCSALFELANYADTVRAARYRALAEKQLRTLSSAAFRAGEGENGHFLLMHGVGHLPAKSEVDVPLVYADYYFLEALGRAVKR
jgi:unsaturated chondroitin disaccharide hydrolase